MNKPKISKLPVMKEHDLQILIIHWLQAHQFYVMRLNAGKIKTHRGHLVKLGEAGTPDLMAFKKINYANYYDEDLASEVSIIEPCLLFIEVKTPKNPTPTFLQKQKMKELEEHGARCMVVHSLKELKEGIKHE